MTRRVVITGCGLVSPFGDSPAALTEALDAQLSALVPVEQFPTDGLTCRHAGELRDFQPKTYLSGNLRPLDRLSRMVAAGARLALDDSGWTADGLANKEVGLVLGTMFSSIQVIAAFDRRGVEGGPAYSKPMEFANSVLNSAAGQTAIWHNLRGINSTICCGSASGVAAIAYAANMIRLGRADALLAGGAEGLSHEVFHGYHQAGALCASEDGDARYPVPYDSRRNGFALAEGAALLMLEARDTAEARGATIFGEILGHGNGFDVRRGTDDASAVEAATRSIRMALESASLSPEEIDCLSASANGSVALDRREAGAIRGAFGGRTAALPVTAIKSMLGESLGAGGAFQTVALLSTLNRGKLPGVRGLVDASGDCGLPGLARQTAQIDARRGLVHAMRLDGGAASLVVGGTRAGL